MATTSEWRHECDRCKAVERSADDGPPAYWRSIDIGGSDVGGEVSTYLLCQDCAATVITVIETPPFVFEVALKDPDSKKGATAFWRDGSEFGAAQATVPTVPREEAGIPASGYIVGARQEDVQDGAGAFLRAQECRSVAMIIELAYKGHYYQSVHPGGEVEWTGRIDEARRFNTAHEAGAFARKHIKAAVRIIDVHVYTDGRVVPIPSAEPQMMRYDGPSQILGREGKYTTEIGG